MFIHLIVIHLSHSSNQALPNYVRQNNPHSLDPRLERLLKDAILHGAKLGRSKKDLEEQLAQQKVEQGRLQRRVMQLTQEVVVSPRGRIGWLTKDAENERYVLKERISRKMPKWCRFLK